MGTRRLEGGVRACVALCRALVAVALVLALGGCAGLVEAAEAFGAAAQRASEEPARPDVTLLRAVSGESCSWAEELVTRAYTQALRSYAQGRVVPAAVPARGPVLFSAWKAHDDYLASEASPEGQLTLWADDYYVTHEWSYYGQRILTMVPGDNVEINERIMQVEGVLCYPKEAYLDEMRALLGDGVVILQTCVPNSNLNRIVYGSWVTA